VLEDCVSIVVDTEEPDMLGLHLDVVNSSSINSNLGGEDLVLQLKKRI